MNRKTGFQNRFFCKPCWISAERPIAANEAEKREIPVFTEGDNDGSGGFCFL